MVSGGVVWFKRLPRRFASRNDGGGVVCGVYGFSQDHISLGGLALVGVLSAVIAKMGSERKSVEARFRELPAT